jgi:hypothetical protein
MNPRKTLSFWERDTMRLVERLSVPSTWPFLGLLLFRAVPSKA